MEASRRRFSVLCSHLCPIASFDSPTSYRNTSLSTSYSSSQSRQDEHHHRASASEEENDGTLVKDCVFCRIIHGQSPAYKLYEDANCFCILDTSPLSRGHALLIPKAHFSSLDATPPSVIAAMCSKIPFISNAIKKATSCDSFNLLVNNGAAAGQVIFHTHIHIIPRKARDRLWAHKSLQRLSLKLDEEASQLAECIREQMSSQSKTEDFKSRAATGG